MERMQPDHGYAPGELPVDIAALAAEQTRMRVRREWRLAWRAARKLGEVGRNLPFSIGGHLEEAVRMLETRNQWESVEARATIDAELRRIMDGDPFFKLPKRPFSRGPVGGRLP